MPFPFIIRPGKNKKLEHNEEAVRKDNSERAREKQVVSSSSENEQSESDKQTSSRKPLGFPVSQLLNDPSDSCSKSPGQETATRPGNFQLTVQRNRPIERLIQLYMHIG